MKLLTVNKQNKDDFKNIVNGDKLSIMLYYADWCPHCAFFKPTWNKLYNDNFKNSRSVCFIQVEHSDMNNIPKKYSKNVMGFPSIHLLKNGKVISEYSGSRDTSSLLEFINKHK